MEDRRPSSDGASIAKSLPGGTEQHERRVAGVDVHRHSAATTGADNHIGTMLVAGGLRNPHGLGKILIGQRRINHLVPVAGEITWLHAARYRLPAVEEEDFDPATLPWLGFRGQQFFDQRHDVARVGQLGRLWSLAVVETMGELSALIVDEDSRRTAEMDLIEKIFAGVARNHVEQFVRAVLGEKIEHRFAE